MWKIENTWWISFKDGGENNVLFSDVLLRLNDGFIMTRVSWDVMFHDVTFYTLLPVAKQNKSNVIYFSVCVSLSFFIKPVSLQQIDSETQERKWIPCALHSFWVGFLVQGHRALHWQLSTSANYASKVLSKNNVYSIIVEQTCLFCV